MKKLSIYAFLIFLITTAALIAQDKKFTNLSVARLSFLAGTTYIQTASDLAYEEGVVNMPLSEGDRVATDGRAEISLGQNNYIRLDHNTKIDLEGLPSLEERQFQIQVWAGNVYLNIRTLKNEKDFEILTPDVSLYVLDTGIYRIDVRPNAETEIFVFTGLLEAAGEAGSVLIKDEQRLEATEGYFTSKPTSFFANTRDSFDRWSENRDSIIKEHLAEQFLPEDLHDFEHELLMYGRWIDNPPFGWVWVPGGVDSSWRPYHSGRWMWIPICGWTWLPYESWGWVTHHYGRWQWSPFYGWYWIPGSVWGPGWVSWYWGSDYIGWAPMSYWGYPGVVIENSYYGRYQNPQYPSTSRALTVIRKNQLQARNVAKISLNRESVQKLGKFSLNNRAPESKPVRNTIDVQKVEKNGSRVILRNKDAAGELPLSSDRPKNPESARTDPTPSKSSEKVRSYPSSSSVSAKNDSLNKAPGSSKKTSALRRIFQHITQKSSTASVSKGSSGTAQRSSSKSPPPSSGASSARASSSKSSSSRVKKIKK